jgi:uncharacterized Zn finger protein
MCSVKRVLPKSKRKGWSMQLTEKEIATSIPEPYYSRGKTLFKAGMLHFVSVTEEVVEARVVGTRVYKVKLKRSPKGLIKGECTCPAYRDFGPCKHIAAVGFAVVNKAAGKVYQASEDCLAFLEEQEAFDTLLQNLSKAELIDLVEDLCNEEERLRDYILEYYGTQ